MRLSIDVALHYRLPEERAVSLVLEPAAGQGQRVLRSDLSLEAAFLRRVPGDAGVGERIWALLPGEELSLRYEAEVETAPVSAPLSTLSAVPPWELPAEAMPYLRASRYIEADRFQAFAARKFAGLSGGARIAAMAEWIGRAMEYIPGASDAETTAVDSFAQRQGVCRDYAHLLCALARASRIPARCAAVYGPEVDPPDFHLVAQVFLDGAWRLVDPTGMCAPDAMALIAVGRDVGDVAFMETEGPAILLSQSVAVRRI